ncbi:hypothetical protein FQR65_LT12030 [Abscondita terminalis]|nr:hypothetical protein FQR65_LT12030 [Abscondita terminalis]
MTSKENCSVVVSDKQSENQSKLVKDEVVPENNLTVSTKLSTEQLICKTPQDSTNSSLKSVKNDGTKKKKKRNLNKEAMYNSLLYLGISQILFGLLMVVFGALVLVHEARLANLGGGLWGGGLAVLSGFAGVLAAAKNWCPLKNSAQKIAHTVFLALSLISVAVSQLVLVFAATGLARDIKCSNESEDNDKILTAQSEALFPNFPLNYLALLSNAGLLVVSGVQCICALVSAYQSSRSLCPCFRRSNETAPEKEVFANKQAFVDYWLGKQSPPRYVVTAPGTLRKTNWFPVAPIIQLPPPPMLRYPLIPAPLGPVPSPLIHQFPKEMFHYKHKPVRKPRRCKPKQTSRETQITTEDVVRTYTGLDRTIAEEFIEICDSQNNSLCSEVSCHSSSCTCVSNSTNPNDNCDSTS